VSRSEEKLLAEVESLYRERFADFVAVAASIVGEREGAREAVQDAFASVVRARRDFRREGRLEAWVWRVVINAARKRKQRQLRELRMRAAAPSMNGAAPPAEEGLGLAALVAALPERQRLVLFLRYYADLDYRGIAQVLDVRTGTVSATLHAAHTNLRRLLSEVPK
jgi:RNA polymerase sigma factor (sigma-70 family)